MSSLAIDPANAFTGVCKPSTEIPAWWSGFLFHVLTARQVSVYLYLSMLCDEAGVCCPTSAQIRQDLGLNSLTIIFDAVNALERFGFLLRETRNVPALKSRRNVYQRPSCEYTVMRLLAQRRLDGLLRPVPGQVNAMSEDSRRLRDAWLERALGDAYETYRAAPLERKGDVLLRSLRSTLGGPA